jgi:hypothetical protein
MTEARATNVLKISIGAVATVAVLLAGIVAVHAASGGHRQTLAARKGHAVDPRQKPYFDPARFTTRIDNAWFPLKPGIRYVYRGSSEGTPMRDVFTVTRRTKVVDGVTTRVVNDRVFSEGHLEEKTFDYYVQDDQGNVWYFGEDTAEYNERGKVTSTEGTWRAGRHGAEPGLFIEAYPQRGHTFQQEFQRGVAEDFFTVLTLKASVKVPYGTFGRSALRRNVLVTKEWTPLEPKIRDHKVYVRGIGEVKEITVKGGQEVARLVKIVRV